MGILAPEARGHKRAVGRSFPSRAPALCFAPVPFRDDAPVYESPVLTIFWERPDPELPRRLVLLHDPGEAGVPEQRRLPEGFGLEAIGGVLGLLGLGALVLHRVARRVRPQKSRVRFDPSVLVVSRDGDARSWPTATIAGFGAGEDTPEWRTVFVTHADGRELLLEGLPPDDARRAVEILDDARRLFGP